MNSLPGENEILPVHEGNAASETQRLQSEMKALERRLTKIEKKAGEVRNLALDRAVQEMALELCSYMTPVDPVGLEFERVGRDFDGGYIMVRHEASSRIAYSLGINRDVSWDLAMAERGYKVFQYDHTIDRLPLTHPNFTFHRLGITGPSLVTDQLRSLDEQIISNSHADQHNMVLKMDIEGHEWEVFSEISESDLSRFTQILIECHSFGKMHKLFWYRKARQALRNLAKTHRVVHVHGNNNSPMIVLGGVAMPQTLELTWFRRDLCEFSACTRRFPTPLDQPNNPNYSDHCLGNFCFA